MNGQNSMFPHETHYSCRRTQEAEFKIMIMNFIKFLNKFKAMLIKIII